MNDEEKKELEKQENEVRDWESIEVDSPEELQKLLDQLAGSGNNGKKVKKINIVNRLFPNIFVNLLFYIIFISLVTIALEGYLDIFSYAKFYSLIIFCLGFSILDTLGRDLLYYKIPFIVITSFGLVTIIYTIIIALLMATIIPNFGINSYGIFILYIAILLVLRVIITMYVSRIMHKIKRKKIIRKI